MLMVLQMGTLGAGNHYAEVQVIDRVFDRAAARKMGIDEEGQVRITAPAHLSCSTLFACMPFKCHRWSAHPGVYHAS
jgi:hypothetical protein